jgi:uncharacterized protein GlcG (DUF336 family)
VAVSLDEAQQVISAVVKEALRRRISVSVAVVDKGGLLVALARMDDAIPLTVQVAEAKAVGSALWLCNGDEIASIMDAQPSMFHQIDRLALIRMPLMPSPGSLLIRRRGRVIGAVGVSGGPPEIDVECARAGLDALVVARRPSRRSTP